MCGVAGILRQDSGSDQRSVLLAMSDAMLHRGPDASGIWQDDNVALAHRRLSILDLSEAGAQPMVARSARYVISFNGEIYNHGELRRQLEQSGPVQWKGHSDTEVLLEALDQWGWIPTLRATIGMFAILVWDRQDRKLLLARDRLGEKPLYYGVVNGGFVCASELHAFRQIPNWHPEVCLNALSGFMRNGYVTGAGTIYEGVFKLPPGHSLEVPLRFSDRFSPQPYWVPASESQSGIAGGEDGNLVERLEFLLEDAIRHQMVSDVPVGAFLSGGVDSTTVVALMQKNSGRKVQTFTIGFQDPQFDESGYAAEVARHLGTDHHSLDVTPADALATVADVHRVYDEPFADASQLPTMLVSRLASQSVKVVLSGDGADELFGGYNRYLITDRVWHRMQHIPLSLRQGMAACMQGISPRHWESMQRLGMRLWPSLGRQTQIGDKAHKFANLMAARDESELYGRITALWTDGEYPVLGVAGSGYSSLPIVGSSLCERMMRADTLSYLPDDILVKVDRAAMAVSLETRAPFLDHRIVEFAQQLPLGLKIRNGSSKWILRQVLYKYVPQQLVDRPKMGFGVPIGDWLRGPLRDWAESLLDEGRLREEGYLSPEKVRACWKDHLSGQRNFQYRLWAVLMFQSWLDSVGRNENAGRS
jgi:asparagine synthase (glutamine-hydrolysing)